MDTRATPRTADRLLLLLKTHGAMTTAALARALGISVPAVRQHLQAQADSVVSEERSEGVGRPARWWRLSEAAQTKFPDTHAELTVRILESIEGTLGPAALDAVVQARFEHTLSAYRDRLTGLSTLRGRVQRLARIRSEEGYMAEALRDGQDWILVEHHCPICAAATACQGFCRKELELFRTVLGPEVQVERTEYLLEGGERCAYRIRAAG